MVGYTFPLCVLVKTLNGGSTPKGGWGERQALTSRWIPVSTPSILAKTPQNLHDYCTSQQSSAHLPHLASYSNSFLCRGLALTV